MPEEEIRIPISTPKTLLVFYGWPVGINDAHLEPDPIATAAAELGRYAYVVLGAGLEKDTHPSHAPTVAILGHVDTAETHFFGYVDLGVSTSNLTREEIRASIDEWLAVGVDGIFLDDYGYDFLVTRSRQNDAVLWAHGRGLSVCANAWEPADAFGATADPDHNPDGEPTLLGSEDFYLWESYQIQEGTHVTSRAWFAKRNALRAFRETHGFRVLATTTPDPGGAFDASALSYAWWSGVLDEIEGLGWGEPNYAANGTAPFRERPSFDCGSAFTGATVQEGDWLLRATDTGHVGLNAVTHEHGCR